MAFLDQNPAIGYPLVAGLGLLVGSFLNVVLLRLPRRLEWQWKRDAHEVQEQPDVSDPPPPATVSYRSRCAHCLHPHCWYANIPGFRWLALPGEGRDGRAPR